MPKKTLFPETELLARIAGRFPNGGTPDDFIRAMETPLPKRTIQRRLTLLVDQGRLHRDGKGPSTRYRIPPPTPTAETPPIRRSKAELSLSPEAKSIQDAVRQPISLRKPVGYNRAFLDGYRPNETFYLSTEIRQHLATLGMAPQENLPAGTYVREVLNRLLIDLSWNSSRLEGNTYSLLETERLMEMGETADGKDAREAQMILNHKAAIELLADDAAEIRFNRHTICNLHALLSEELLANPLACGRVRNKAVGITGTVFFPLANPQVLDECFDNMLDSAEAIRDPFEQAFFIMVQLPYLQPFEDVNKRVSRLAANIPLIRMNLSPLSFVDVPERNYTAGILGVYELNRVELLRDVFVWAYERSCGRYSSVRQSLGEPDPFRMRYRAQIGRFVSEAVLTKLDKHTAAKWIASKAKIEIPEADRQRFIEVVETELSCLHEGNISRYRLRPSEFAVWYATWR